MELLIEDRSISTLDVNVNSSCGKDKDSRTDSRQAMNESSVLYADKVIRNQQYETVSYTDNNIPNNSPVIYNENGSITGESKVSFVNMLASTPKEDLSDTSDNEPQKAISPILEERHISESRTTGRMNGFEDESVAIQATAVHIDMKEEETKKSNQQKIQDKPEMFRMTTFLNNNDNNTPSSATSYPCQTNTPVSSNIPMMNQIRYQSCTLPGSIGNTDMNYGNGNTLNSNMVERQTIHGTGTMLLTNIQSQSATSVPQFSYPSTTGNDNPSCTPVFHDIRNENSAIHCGTSENHPLQFSQPTYYAQTSFEPNSRCNNMSQSYSYSSQFPKNFETGIGGHQAHQTRGDMQYQNPMISQYWHQPQQMGIDNSQTLFQYQCDSRTRHFPMENSTRNFPINSHVPKV